MTHSLTLREHLGVTFWRSAMGALALFGGKAVPRNRVSQHRYGPGPMEQLDRWQPAPGRALKPVVVHIHGGGWISGSKGRFYTRPLTALADQGHPVFSLNYPLGPKAAHPEALLALLRALAWIKSNHAQGHAIHLTGDSAGGHLAMMLAIMLSNPKILRLYDPIDSARLPNVLSAAPLYGVHDRISAVEDKFPGISLFLKSLAGPDVSKPGFRSPTPVMALDLPAFANLPRTFIVAGGKDPLARSSLLFFDRLKTTFPETRYKLYPGAAHGFFNFGTGSAELTQDLIAFLAEAAILKEA